MNWKTTHEEWEDPYDGTPSEEYIITDGKKRFSSDFKKDADWLCALLNKLDEPKQTTQN